MSSMTQAAVPVNAVRLAKQGDARALLAIPEAREDIPRLIRGDKASRLNLGRPYMVIPDQSAPCGSTYRYIDWGFPRESGIATDFAGRKAINAAKAIVAEREARRAARKVAEAVRNVQPGRALRLLAERRAARIEARRSATHPVLFEAFKGLYRVYESEIATTFGQPAVNVRTTTKYVSGRGGFGHVTDGQTTHLTVPETWLDDVHAHNLDYVDGMLTLSAELVETTDGIEVFRATWVRQGRGYELYAESGMIARHVHFGGAVTTFHSASSDPKKAVSGLRRKLTVQGLDPAEAQARRTARQQARAAKQAASLARLVARVAAWDLAEIQHVIVRRADSLKAGNCEPGTDDFIARFFPDRHRDSEATIGEIAQRVGRLNIASLKEADMTFARQLAAACLVAVRKDKQAKRLVMA
jgi:hypothetical protein